MLQHCLSCFPLAQDQHNMSRPLRPRFHTTPLFHYDYKFPLDQCCWSIAAVSHLAQPCFPNGLYHEGLVWPHHHHSTSVHPPIIHPHVQKPTWINTCSNQINWIIDAYISDAFVRLYKSYRKCKKVCMCMWCYPCGFRNPPFPHHHRKLVLSPPSSIRNSICCPTASSSLSLSFHFPRDPELTNTQTVCDVKKWTRWAFRPLTLTVEGIECGKLWAIHAVLNRQ